MYVLPDAHVTTLAVDPAWHRRAIGTRLLVALARAAVTTGATALTLEVRASNQAAQELYRRFGFAPAGVRKAYYADTGEDALIMWAHDTDSPAFSVRLDEIAAAIPGSTSVDPAA
jgi:ribosomal-protein-alanine N-acetyltransferase